MSIHKTMARNARKSLGRAARRTSYYPDWQAWDAVRAAAIAAGLTGQLLQYVTRAQSLTEMSAAYVSRYVQAYGPVGDLIDVGAHLGHRTALVVEVRS